MAVTGFSAANAMGLAQRNELPHSVMDRRDVLAAGPTGTDKKPTPAGSLVHGLFARGCKDTQSSDTCEKPASSNPETVGIAVAVVVAVLVIGGVLFYLHRRSMQRLKKEDTEDPHKSWDFGLSDGNGAPKQKRKSLFMGGGEKSGMHKTSQLSMDMNLSSPYLLPPGAHDSHESLNSIARSLGQDARDPYQMASNGFSESGSIRSLPRGKDSSSIYTKSSSNHMSVATGKSVPPGRMPPPRTNSLPQSPESPVVENPFMLPTKPQPAHTSPVDSEKDQFNPQPIIPEIGAVSDFDEKRDSQPFSPPESRAMSAEFPLPPGNHGKLDDGPQGLGFDFGLPPAGIATAEATAQTAPIIQTEKFAAYQPPIQHSTYDENEDTPRGRSVERTSYVEDTPPQQGLGVPKQNNKRLSVGLRPLPPDEITDSEDPEYRANRIRSFYKEYFDDSKEAAPPMPPMPSGAGYYEDYDPTFLPEAAAYFDPETNAFVMPYAEQNVTRRAMTPPPAGRRPGPGPRRGPRPPHGGSMGGSMGGGRPRAGSAFGPRPDSSASARLRQAKKKLPPPSPLTTLPTPSKLKDDSFSMMSAIDFAPPDRIKDSAAGRSQSPLGERRPYSPAVPVASPLVTAFDDLAALPSPHLLRKSGTFTALDFAPPKKFHDADTMSDSGSIKSNRSGLSAAQRGAIRAGAGRVSRLPGDTVFTQASMQDTLKPQWGMGR